MQWNSEGSVLCDDENVILFSQDIELVKETSPSPQNISSLPPHSKTSPPPPSTTSRPSPSTHHRSHIIPPHPPPTLSNPELDRDDDDIIDNEDWIEKKQRQRQREREREGEGEREREREREGEGERERERGEDRERGNVLRGREKHVMEDRSIFDFTSPKKYPTRSSNSTSFYGGGSVGVLCGVIDKWWYPFLVLIKYFSSAVSVVQ